LKRCNKFGKWYFYRICFCEAVPENHTAYDFVLIDSVSRAGFDLDYLRQLRQDNPRISFILIYHTSKGGNIRCKQEHNYEEELAIEVLNGKAAMGNGRFGIGSEIEI